MAPPQEPQWSATDQAANHAPATLGRVLVQRRILAVAAAALLVMCVVLTIIVYSGRLSGPATATSLQTSVRSVQRLSDLVVLRVNISTPTIAEGWISKTIIIAKGDVDLAVDLSKATMTLKPAAPASPLGSASGNATGNNRVTYVFELPAPRVVRPRVRAADVEIFESSSGLLRPLLLVYNDRDELVLKAMSKAEETIAKMAAMPTYTTAAKLQAESVIRALLSETDATIEFIWK